MADRAAGVGFHADVLPVPAFPVGADQHPPLFPGDRQHQLAACRAGRLGYVVVHEALRAVLHRLHQLLRVPADVGQEGGGVGLLPADGVQLLLPLGGQQRLLQVGGHQADDLRPLGRGHQGHPLFLHIKGGEQLLDDIRPGGRGAQPSANELFHLLVVDVRGGVFHGGQQGGLCVSGRRRGLERLALHQAAGVNVPPMEQGHRLFVGFVLVPAVLHLPPPLLEHCSSGGVEPFPLGQQLRPGAPVLVGGIETGQKPFDHHQINPFLLQGEAGQIRRLLGGDDGVVIRHLGIVDAGLGDGTPVPLNFGHIGGEFPPGHGPQPFGQGGDDVLGQVTGIGAGVGEHLVNLIQPLHDRQGVLGRHLVLLVGISLQLGQIVQHGRRGGFVGGLHVVDPEFLPLDFFRQRLGLCLVKNGGLPLPVLPGDEEFAQIRLHHVVILGYEALDLLLPPHDERQGGGLHPPGGQLRAVVAGHGPGDVEPHQPVGLRPADGGAVQGQIRPPVFQVGEPLPDGLVGLGGNPQPLDRFVKPGLVQDPSGHQLPLPPRVSGDDQGVDFLAVQPGFYHAELLGGFRDHLEGHLFRHHGQAVQAPGLVLAAVMLRLRQLHQVPQRPGHHILRPGHVPASAAMAAQHPGDFLAHRRLFRQYQRLSHRYPAFLSSIVAYSPPVFVVAHAGARLAGAHPVGQWLV